MLNLLLLLGFNLTNLTNMYNENVSLQYVYGNDYIIILLLIIAICEILRTAFFIYYQVYKLFGVDNKEK